MNGPARKTNENLRITKRISLRVGTRAHAFKRVMISLLVSLLHQEFFLSINIQTLYKLTKKMLGSCEVKKYKNRVRVTILFKRTIRLIRDKLRTPKRQKNTVFLLTLIVWGGGRSAPGFFIIQNKNTIDRFLTPF